MKISNFRGMVFMLGIGFFVTGCGSDDGASNIVACDLPQFNQCAEWINLTDALVVSLSATCVNTGNSGDSGVIIDACPTENLIGICEELDNPGGAPDRLNYFYSSPTYPDPVEYAYTKEQACILDAGGVWVPAN